MTVTTIDTSKYFAADKAATASVHEGKEPLVALSHLILGWTQHFQEDLKHMILASDEAAADAYGIYANGSSAAREHLPHAATKSHPSGILSRGAVAPIVAMLMAELLKEARAENAGQEHLASALRELAELDDYALEDERQPPTPVSKELARSLLETLTRIMPRSYALSVGEDGDVVVYSSGGIGWRVSVCCRANGGASLYVTRPDNKSRDFHYRSAKELPVGHVIDALREMPR